MNKKIIIISAPHPHQAAGIVAYDMMKALVKLNNDVQIITNSYLADRYFNTISVYNPYNYWRKKIIRKVLKLVKLLKKTNSDFCMHSLSLNNTDTYARRIIKKSSFKPDFFIYLFPQNFLGPKDLYYLFKKTQSPVFWIMMDMSPFTGGCHYTWSCRNYEKQCGNCPGIFSNRYDDKTNKNWLTKNKYFNLTKLIPIAASQEQFKQVTKSSLFSKKKIFKSFIPVDFDVFKTADKYDVRKKLGLPIDKKIIFFGSVSISEKRKGFKELVEILNKYYKELKKEENFKIFVVIAGKKNQDFNDKIPFEHKYLGYLNYKMLALAYQASDVFISPSIEDSGPMMINQSISCGTPVVAFKIGVALDLVINKQTGYIAELFDIEEMVKGIDYVLKLPLNEYLEMRNKCFELSRKLLSYEYFVNTLLKILNDNRIQPS
jgi:glycosyltransferase involved in cell wall biosynthesis